MIRFYRVLLNVLSDGRDIWLGIHRRKNSQVVGDFIYYSDGARLTYENWKPNDPNNNKNSEDCAAARNDFNYHWNDASCTKEYGLICEI